MDSVIVACRIRPLTSTEVGQGRVLETACFETPTGVRVKPPQPHLPTADFAFDRVFDETCSQEAVYTAVGRDIARGAVAGYNGTIIAYGETGGGKTHTIEGTDAQPGILPRAVKTVFEELALKTTVDATIRIQFVELYRERIVDLLRSDKPLTSLKVREDATRGIWVEGATEVVADDAAHVAQVLAYGRANRSVAETRMNKASSRSHSIVMMVVEQRSLVEQMSTVGKLFIVDLAGSEKLSKTGVQGKHLLETVTINKSLSALGNVINSLTDERATHVPYRDSKLTRVLQESLGGNTRTSLCVCCSPAESCLSETLSTLRFGQRAKRMPNCPRANIEKSPSEYKRLLAEAEREAEGLRRQLGSLVCERLHLDQSDYALVAAERDSLRRENDALRKQLEAIRGDAARSETFVDGVRRVLADL